MKFISLVDYKTLDILVFNPEYIIAIVPSLEGGSIVYLGEHWGYRVQGTSAEIQSAIDLLGYRINSICFFLPFFTLEREKETRKNSKKTRKKKKQRSRQTKWANNNIFI